jgi:hypothetical protein
MDLAHTFTGVRAMASKVGRLLCDFEFTTLEALHPAPTGTPTGQIQFRRILRGA